MQRSFERNDEQSTFLFLIVDVLIATYFVLDLIAQILPPHYSPISQAESDLAVGPFGYIMSLNFLLRGVLSIVFLIAFTRALDMARLHGSKIRTGVYLMVVWSIGSAILAIFPTDVSTSSPTIHGAIHLVVAIIAFIGGGMGAFLISNNLPRKGAFLRIQRIALPLSYLVVLFLVSDLILPFVLPHIDQRIGGLVERLFLGALLLWVGVVSTLFLSIMKSQENRIHEN